MNVDTSKVNNYQDSLCEAIEVISSNLLKKVSYDKTIVATITDTTDKKDGKYQCSNGTNTFTAYSTKTDYEEGSSVYITIPNGDWENQKIIIGKKTGEDTESPFLYTTPLMSILDMTGNLIDKPLKEEYSLTANGKLIQDEETGEWKYIDSLFLDDEIEIYSAEIESETLIPSEMTRLVLSADFKTLLSGAVKGTYGIRIKITGVPADSAIAEKEEENKSEAYEFTNAQMFGNTYNFASYYNQQISLDISGFNQIKKISVSLFQDGDFSTDAEKLVWREELFKDIFCKNVYLCAGKKIELFDTDQLNIWTDDGITYKKEYTDNNEKTIKMSWVHVEDKIAKVMNYKNSGDYYIRWYKYSVGAQAGDAYCGTNWKKEEEYNLTEEANWGYKFKPDTERQQSIIKAIIFKKIDDIIVCVCRSNELTFNNDEIVPSQETIDKDSALAIVVEDGSEGDYYLYGQDKRIYEETDRQRVRKLGCKFKEYSDSVEEDLYAPSDGFTFTSIKWKFLKENSMFEVLNKDNKQEDSKYWIVSGEKEPQYRLNRELISEKESVIVELTRYNRTYTTIKEFNFGKRGTMGTDTTLIVNLNKGANEAIALPRDEDISNYKLEIKIIKNGKEQELTADEEKEIVWTIEDDNNEEKNFSYSGGVLSLSSLANSSEDSLFIATVEFGDLSTCYAIPTYSSTDDIIPSYLVGPTTIIYDSAGLPDYKESAYELYDVNNNIIKDLTWEIYSPKIEEEVKKGKDADEKETIRKNLENYIGTIKGGKLIPAPFYIKDAPIYGVRAIKDEKVIWTQPILVIQNRWASGVINNWDGKTVEINEKGYVLSPAVAAGKKNDDNSFSGVMIGDWSINKDTSDEITINTGVYGFDKGAMAYALKDDGTAFFGAEDKGRIYIDGNKATLYSSGWDQMEKNKKKANSGMQIDLNQPSIKMKKREYDSKEKQYKDYDIVLDASEEIYPFQIGENFKSSWNGSIYATNGEFSGTLYATGGEIRGDLEIVDGGCLSVEVNRTDASDTSAVPIEIIDSKSGKKIGGFGLIRGEDNGTLVTYNVGISSGNVFFNDRKPSIILESSNNIRLTAENDIYIRAIASSGGIYFDQGKVYVNALYCKREQDHYDSEGNYTGSTVYWEKI